MKYTHEQLMFAAQVAQLAEAKASAARQLLITAAFPSSIDAKEKTAFIQRAISTHAASEYYSVALEEIVNAAAYVHANLS